MRVFNFDVALIEDYVVGVEAETEDEAYKKMEAMSAREVRKEGWHVLSTIQGFNRNEELDDIP